MNTSEIVPENLCAKLINSLLNPHAKVSVFKGGGVYETYNQSNGTCTQGKDLGNNVKRVSPITHIKNTPCVINLSTTVISDLSGIDDTNNSIRSLTPCVQDLCTPVSSNCMGLMDTNNYIERVRNPSNVSCESSSVGYFNIKLNPYAKPFVPQTPCTDFLTDTMGNTSGPNSDDEIVKGMLFQEEPIPNDVLTILKNLRVKNHNRIIVRNLRVVHMYLTWLKSQKKKYIY